MNVWVYHAEIAMKMLSVLDFLELENKKLFPCCCCVLLNVGFGPSFFGCY